MNNASASHPQPDFQLAELTVSMRDLARVLFRHQWKIVLVFLLSTVTVAMAMLITPSFYQSEAKLLIRVGRESVSVDPQLLGKSSVSVKDSRENIINSEIIILKSRYIADRVVEKFGPEPILGIKDGSGPLLSWQDQLHSWLQTIIFWQRDNPDKTSDTNGSLHEKAAVQIMRSLSVKPEKDSNVIKVSIESHDPVLARDLLSSLVDFYFERHISIHQEQISPEFIKTHTDKLRVELKEKEGKLQKFRDDYGVFDVKAQKDTLLAQIRSLNDRISELEAQNAASEAKIKSLRHSLADMSETTVLNRKTNENNTVSDDIKRQLVKLKLKETELAALYSSDARPLVDVRRQISQANKSLNRESKTRSEVTVGINSTHQRLSLELEIERANREAQLSKVQSLQTILGDKELLLADLVDYEIIMGGLDREVQIAEKTYLKFSENLQRTEIASALDSSKITNISILQPATLRSSAIKPRKKLNLLLAMFAGLIGGVFLAFILDFFDDSLQTNEDVARKLGLPVLATFSQEEYQKCT